MESLCKIIENKNDLKILYDDLKNTDKKIFRLCVQGPLQKAHRNIIKEMRKISDVVIVEYNELFEYISFVVYDTEYPGRPTYMDVKMSGNRNPDIDYFIINKLPDENYLFKLNKKIKEDYPIIRDECRRLNLSSRIAIETLFIHATMNDVKRKTNLTDIVGPKMVLQTLLHNKCFSNKYKNYPKRTFESLIDDCHWVFYKDEDGNVLNRSGPAFYTFIRKKVYDLLKQGETKFSEFYKVANANMLPDYHFSLIDLKTLEKIDEISDYCVFVFSSFAAFNFIFIINGEIIY